MQLQRLLLSFATVLLSSPPVVSVLRRGSGPRLSAPAAAAGDEPRHLNKKGWKSLKKIEYCPDGEEILHLEVHLDMKPEETGWSLHCANQDGTDTEHVWQVAPGTFTIKEAWAKETTCINPKTTTCTLNLIDSAGDGFDSTGFYALTLGATTVATKEHGVPVVFSTISMCVGVDCKMTPLEFQNEDPGPEGDGIEIACGDDQELLQWQIKLDSYPDETGWMLECDKTPVWDVLPGSYTQKGQMITKTTCIDNDIGYCEMTLLDSSSDGLDKDGWYTLMLGDETLAVSTENQRMFHSKRTFCFGPECQAGCSSLWFEMELDLHPQETRLDIVCDDAVIWSHIPSDDTKPNDWILHDEQCIDGNACCKLVVHDEGNDGLETGFIYMEVNGDVAFHYNPMDDKRSFRELKFAFSGGHRHEGHCRS